MFPPKSAYVDFVDFIDRKGEIDPNIFPRTSFNRNPLQSRPVSILSFSPMHTYCLVFVISQTNLFSHDVINYTILIT